jgi:hypothetical protein
MAVRACRPRAEARIARSRVRCSRGLSWRLPSEAAAVRTHHSWRSASRSSARRRGSPSPRVQRTRAPRPARRRSPLTRRRFAGGRLFAVVLAFAMAGSACASLGDGAAWADGEVRDLATRRPIRGALVFIEFGAGGVDSSGSDRTNEAGHFAVYRGIAGGQHLALLVVVAEGFKRAEYPLPILQGNSLIVRLAPTGSSEASRVEQMPAPPGESDGNSDSDCAVRDSRPREA